MIGGGIGQSLREHHRWRVAHLFLGGVLPSPRAENASVKRKPNRFNKISRRFSAQSRAAARWVAPIVASMVGPVIGKWLRAEYVSGPANS
jgi:hypothetical protein